MNSFTDHNEIETDIMENKMEPENIVTSTGRPCCYKINDETQYLIALLKKIALW